jgi:hypothetical protein
MRSNPRPGPATRPVGVFEPADDLEPALKLTDVCKLRSQSRRTGERERSAGLWPKPDFFVGAGPRKSPRWWPRTIRRWMSGGDQ